MARINIEDSIFIDGRFIMLKSLVGSEEKAIGMLVLSWRIAQTYFKKGENIPHKVFEGLGFLPIFEVDLATKEDDGYYVCGTREQFAWIDQRSEAGKKSGEARRKIREAKRSLNEASTDVERKETDVERKETDVERKETDVERKSNGGEPLTHTHSLTHTQNTNTNTNTLVDESTLPVVSEKKEARQNNFDELVALFNSLHDAHGMPRIKVLTPERKRRIQKAQKAIGSDFEVWRKVFIISGTKGFIKADGSFWKPDFDYVFRNENYIKFSEASQEGEEKTLGEKLRERFGDR